MDPPKRCLAAHLHTCSNLDISLCAPPLCPWLQALFQGVSPVAAAFLHISVRRGHVVEDALNQLVLREAELKKPLRVTFISGGVAEPAQVGRQRGRALHAQAGYAQAGCQ